MMIADAARPALWKTVGRTVLAVILAAIVVLWSWNTLAGDLFALPEMQFRHALAVVLVAAILHVAARRRPGHPS